MGAPCFNCLKKDCNISIELFFLGKCRLTVTIKYYESATGNCPYLEWEAGLSADLRAQIRKRINRVRLGNFGDIDHIEGCIFELCFHVGAGYLIYYAKKNSKVVILLCGGNKRSQERDIEKAKRYWQDLGGRLGGRYGTNQKL